MKLHDGLHVSQFPDGRVEICAGLETLLCLPQLPPKITKLLNSLVKGCSYADLKNRAQHNQIPLPQLDEILNHLDQAQLINRSHSKKTAQDDSTWLRIGGKNLLHTYHNRSKLTVSLNRSDRIGQLLAIELAGAGIGYIATPHTSREKAPDLAESRLRSIKDILDSRNLPTKVLEKKPTVNLAVLIDWGITNLLDTHLMLRKNQIFLPIVAGHDYAEVGPLVIPGITACPNCLMHHRRKQIPEIAAQAVGLDNITYPRIETSLAALSAAVACSQILAFLDERNLNPGKVTRIDIDGNIHAFRFEPHPNCGCREISAPPTASQSALAEPEESSRSSKSEFVSPPR